MMTRSQIFRPGINTISRVSIFVGALILVQLILILIVFFRSNYWRQVNVPIQQPIPFSHQIHAGVIGTDCRYCHTSVAVSSFANIPPTETCVTCHSQVKQNSVYIQPVWQSLQTGESIEWIRVHDLPGFVYFNHSIHVNKGIGCSNCHGRIDQMPVVWKEQALFMGWCLDCHRQPEQYIRPVEEVYNMEWVAPPNQLEMGRELVQQYNIDVDRLSNCYICHR